jgi:hypothetical protein
LTPEIRLRIFKVVKDYILAT